MSKHSLFIQSTTSKWHRGRKSINKADIKRKLEELMNLWMLYISKCAGVQTEWGTLLPHTSRVEGCPQGVLCVPCDGVHPILCRMQSCLVPCASWDKLQAQCDPGLDWSTELPVHVCFSVDYLTKTFFLLFLLQANRKILSPHWQTMVLSIHGFPFIDWLKNSLLCT